MKGTARSGNNGQISHVRRFRIWGVVVPHLPLSLFVHLACPPQSGNRAIRLLCVYRGLMLVCRFSAWMGPWLARVFCRRRVLAMHCRPDYDRACRKQSVNGSLANDCLECF